jgi:6-phosphofructokinase 1
MGYPVVGVASTIDNDLYGTEISIGVNSALDVALEAIDRLKVTAASHERAFIVEVMGRERGFLASTVGVTVGAEVIIVPENECNLDEVIKVIKENKRKGKRAGIIVAAEGCGKVSELAKAIEEQTTAEVRLTILGYVQRGGSPTARSRLLASLFAEKAVELLCKGQGNRAVGLQKGKIGSVDLEESCRKAKPIDTSLIRINEMLSI